MLIPKHLQNLWTCLRSLNPEALAKKVFGYKILIIGLMFSACSLESVQFSVGTRTDNFEWGFNKENIEYQSRWKKLRLANLGVEGKIDRYCAYIKAAFNFGWVYEGKYQPGGLIPGSGEFFDTLPAAKRANGNAWDFTWGVGYNIRRCAFQFAPMIGWAHQHTYFFTGNYVAVDGFTRRSSSTKFHSHWNGPWIGFDSAYDWDSCLTLNGSFRLHFVHQHGEQQVNAYQQIVRGGVICYRSPFQMTMDDFMMGFFIAGGAHYKLGKCWGLGFHVDYWDLHKVGMTDLECQLGFMRWDSLRCNLDLSYRY